MVEVVIGPAGVVYDQRAGRRGFFFIYWRVDTHIFHYIIKQEIIIQGSKGWKMKIGSATLIQSKAIDKIIEVL